MHEQVIRNGRVGLDSGWADWDVAIDGGRISAIGNGLLGEQIIDAEGLWVLPGGIDAHCHLDQPSWGGADTADDFASGSVSAAYGGTSCIVPFAMPGPGMSALGALERSMSRAAGRSVVDYGFHAVMTPDTGPDIDHQLETLAAKGVPTVKTFMTYEGFAVPDDLLLQIMDSARHHGTTVMVHAENDAAIRRTRERLIASGHTALRYHLVASAMAIEREATHRAITLAEITGARVAILHASGEQSAEEIMRGRARGTEVFAETCPQYLLLDGSMLDAPPEQAARFMFSPPPRTRADNDYLWQALADGRIDLWSSDHSPYALSTKLDPKHLGSFDKTVSGVPGLETRLPLLFSEGLLTGRISLDRYLELSCRNAAEIYGLGTSKGRIAVGFDADLALWDPKRRWQVDHSDMHSNVDFSPFDGRWITGKPVGLMVRGTTVLAEEKLNDTARIGQFVSRSPAGPDTFTSPLEHSTPWQNS